MPAERQAGNKPADRLTQFETTRSSKTLSRCALKARSAPKSSQKADFQVKNACSRRFICASSY
jgi:hypothetical protein